jgi:hypothetical protein
VGKGSGEEDFGRGDGGVSARTGREIGLGGSGMAVLGG